jgi:diguanylate cyclase (GGDEF)-like protein
MNLSERARRPIAACVGLLVAALLGLGAVEAKRSSDLRIGVGVEQGAGGIAVTGVAAGLPAERAGLRQGDVLLAIDGVPTPRLDDYDEIAAGFARGRPVAYEVRRGSEVLALEIVPGAGFPWYETAVNGLGALAYLGLALLALFQAKGDLRARLLFLFSLAVALELALPQSVIGDPQLALATLLAFYFLTGIQIGFELHLASVIPRPQPWLERHRWVVPLYYGVGTVIAVTMIATLVAELVGARGFPWTSAEAQAVLFESGLVVWAAATVLLLAIPAVGHPEPAGRHQAALVLAGVLPWALYLIVSTGLAWMGRPLPLWSEQLQPLFLLCYPVAVFIAIFRYHLFDIELVVRHSLVYTALTGLLLGLFYLAIWVGGALSARLLGGERRSVWVISGAMLVLGLLFAPLRRAVHRAIVRRFFPERLALRDRLVALAAELPAQGKVPRMGRRLAERLCEVFALRGAAVLVADPKSRLLVSVGSSDGGQRDGSPEVSLLLSPDEPGIDLLLRTRRPLPAARLAARAPALGLRLAAARAELVVPLVAHDTLVGLILLGGKRDKGRAFRADEVELLDLLGHHVALVFENARLFESATVETLTGLLRREAVLELLDKELERAQRYGRPLTIGLADIDHFKLVNDRFGHLIGDALLKRVAQAMLNGLRGADAVGRYGGEEFLLVLPETDLAGALAVAEKVRRLVESAAVSVADGEAARATVSIGLATLPEVPGGAPPTAEELLAAADRSLYRAKQAGRNRVEPTRAASG